MRRQSLLLVTQPMSLFDNVYDELKHIGDGHWDL